MKPDGNPQRQEIINQARYLANAHKTMDEATVIREVSRIMRMHYIQGGIGAIDARKVISALLNVCEKFRAVMVGKLQ